MAKAQQATEESVAATEPSHVRPWYRRDPWLDRLPRPLARLEREFEYLMDRVFSGDGRRSPPWADVIPSANLVETETEFEVTVELPGIDRGDVHIELRNGDLWITGEKKEEKEEKGRTLHRVERCGGKFRRVIPLPGSIEESKIEATYKDGILKISLPKSTEAQPRHIEIKS